MEIQIMVKRDGSQANMSKHIMLCQSKVYRVPGDSLSDLINYIIFNARKLNEWVNELYCHLKPHTYSYREVNSYTPY